MHKEEQKKKKKKTEPGKRRERKKNHYKKHTLGHFNFMRLKNVPVNISIQNW